MMKLKVYVIDLSIPPHAKKWGLRVGIPAAVLLGGGAIAYAGLVTWSSGQTLMAADLNGNFSFLQNQITGDGGVGSQVAALQTQVTALQGDEVAVSAYLQVSASGVTIGGGGASGATWISDASRTGAGAVSVTLTGGVFSGYPQCTITPSSGTFIASLPSITNTAITLQTYALSGTPADTNLLLICVGPR
jgi:hypothetical protein